MSLERRVTSGHIYFGRLVCCWYDSQLNPASVRSATELNPCHVTLWSGKTLNCCLHCSTASFLKYLCVSEQMTDLLPKDHKACWLKHYAKAWCYYCFVIKLDDKEKTIRNLFSWFHREAINDWIQAASAGKYSHSLEFVCTGTKACVLPINTLVSWCKIIKLSTLNYLATFSHESHMKNGGCTITT